MIQHLPVTVRLTSFVFPSQGFQKTLHREVFQPLTHWVLQPGHLRHCYWLLNEQDQSRLQFQPVWSEKKCPCRQRLVFLSYRKWSSRKKKDCNCWVKFYGLILYWWVINWYIVYIIVLTNQVQTSHSAKVRKKEDLLRKKNFRNLRLKTEDWQTFWDH